MMALNYCCNILQRMCKPYPKYLYCFQTFILLSTHGSSSSSESETLTVNLKALLAVLSQLKYVSVINYSSVKSKEQAGPVIFTFSSSN